MAAAEARAAWQRAANRCFVQEDAKRAPNYKLPPPCSSSSSSAPYADADADADADAGNTPTSTHDHSTSTNELLPTPTPFHFNWSPNPYSMSTANLPADTRWWLQLHPNFAYQREFLLYEPKSNTAADPLSPLPDSDKTGPPKTSLSMSFVKHGGSIEENAEDWKLRCDVQPWKDPLTPQRSEPWWRVADGEELASMVAQKAVQCVENCDLPRPTQSLRYLCADLHQHSTVEVGMADFGDVRLDAAYGDDGYLLSQRMKESPQGLFDSPLDRDEKLLRDRCGSDQKKQTGAAKNLQMGKGSREELLEALCHSQTRAREAEMAAKKAHSEKEDIVKLLFRQASHLFACKQWLKMLQLENLCLQLRIRDHHFPFPMVLPFNSNSNANSSSNSKLPAPPPPLPRPRSSNSICRCVIVFAVGLGLAGAGLLFGWTLRWLLPKF